MDTEELLRLSEQLLERSRAVIREVNEMSLRATEVIARSDQAMARANELHRTGGAGLPAEPVDRFPLERTTAIGRGHRNSPSCPDGLAKDA